MDEPEAAPIDMARVAETRLELDDEPATPKVSQRQRKPGGAQLTSQPTVEHCLPSGPEEPEEIKEPAALEASGVITNSPPI